MVNNINKSNTLKTETNTHMWLTKKAGTEKAAVKAKERRGKIITLLTWQESSSSTVKPTAYLQTTKGGDETHSIWVLYTAGHDFSLTHISEQL